jgi:hypothetical protein
MLICNHIEAKRSVWVMGPSSGKEQQCGSHAKLSRHRYMCAKSARAWAKDLVEALGTSDAKNSLLFWMVFPPWRPFLVRRRTNISRCADLFAWTAWVSNVALPSSPWVIHSGVRLTRLNCLLWLSIRLYLLSQVLPFISNIHSSPLTYHFP